MFFVTFFVSQANCTGDCIDPTVKFLFEKTEGSVRVKPGSNYTYTFFVVSHHDLVSTTVSSSNTSRKSALLPPDITMCARVLFMVIILFFRLGPDEPVFQVVMEIQSATVTWETRGNVEYIEIFYRQDNATYAVIICCKEPMQEGCFVSQMS